MDSALFLADLEAKPAALRALATTLAADDPWAAVPADTRRVVLLGMGSSLYAAGVAARRLRAAGIDAVAEYASAEAVYPTELAIAISASGTSGETVVAAQAYGSYVALTNDPLSTLAASASTVVTMAAGVEAGGVACRSFQHTLALLLALAARLSGGASGCGMGGSGMGGSRVTGSAVTGLARRAADATEDLLARRDEWLPAVLAALDGPSGVYALAAAERLSSAQQSALMIREGPRRPATGCETGDWSHVDVYLTKTLDYRALLFPGSRHDGAAREWLRERGSTVVAVGADVPGAAVTVRYRHDDDPDVRLLTETLVAELVAASWWSPGY